ncbi:MAG: hypothetical protein AABN34_22075 [Acidobacteriota bacterium]
MAPKELAARLDLLDLNVTSDYYKSFRQVSPTSYRVTAKEYLRGDDRQWSDQSLLCPEMPLPRRVASSVRLTINSGDHWGKTAVGLIHAGRSGCMAPLHFDWDHTWVAHACLLGRKRFFFFPPDAGWLLSPIINTSALCLPKFSEADRDDLISRLGGVEVVLEAGKGVLFPSMFWHGTLYDEASLAVSVRFEPYPGGRPFAALPRSWLLQRLLWRFFQERYGAESNEFLAEYLAVFFRRSRGWKTRYRDVTDLCRTWLLERGEQQGASMLTSESFSAEMVLASRELKRYYNGNGLADEQIDQTSMREVANYIFEAIQRPQKASDLRLAIYALNLRQGLPPKRGLVEIETR